MPEIYISTGVETDGPIPGPNSMLSFASAAFRADGTQVGTFSANLHLLPAAHGHPSTMAFWQENADAYAATRTDLKGSADAMVQYVGWIKSLGGKPVFVAYPAGFDFLFVYWYLIRFTGASPSSHSALDMKTMAMVILRIDYRDSTKRNMPRKWFSDSPHTHVAMDDAIEQGQLSCNMLVAARALREGRRT